MTSEIGEKVFKELEGRLRKRIGVSWEDIISLTEELIIQDLVKKVGERRKLNCVNSKMRAVCTEKVCCGYCGQYFKVLKILKEECK